MGYAIRAEGVGKRYNLMQGGRSTQFREALMGLFKRPQRADPASEKTLWALRDLSLDIPEGQATALIGRNGAGKSTLLKVFSRVTPPTEGIIRVRGRVGSLLEVGTGFHQELSGRENIYLNGAILGMTRREIERKFDEIVAFAEVEKFLETPVKRYSSGMYMRLAFAVAAHLEPEILIVDEVLAVGDAAFQRKSMGKMSDLARNGRTVVFVSHSMAAVQAICTRGAVLDGGKLVFEGDQNAAVNFYLQGVSNNRLSLAERTDREGDGRIRIQSVQYRDLAGNPLQILSSGCAVDIHLDFERRPDFLSKNVIAAIIVRTQADVPVFMLHNRMTADPFGTLPLRGTMVCHIPKLPLPAANYNVGFTILQDGQTLDQFANALPMEVIEGDFFGSGEVPPITHGVALVDGHWTVS
jgi:lipopolysaccharide transport system ATP-binding protein